MPKPHQPNQSWTLTKLAQYALKGIGEIQRAGRHTAAQTYRIGRALHFAHLKLIVKGAWGQWLNEQGIPEKTAWEAIRLYEAVKNENDLEGLTSTEAKIKHGIYPELSESDSKNSGGNSGGSHSIPEDPEQQLALVYHRLKDSLEIIMNIKWRPDFLYSIEADEVLSFSKQIAVSVSNQRKKIKRPPKVDTSGYLD